MKRRQKRILLVVGIVLAVATLAILASQVFRQNLMYFYSASEVVNGEVPAQARVRLGGLVVPGSLQREPGSLKIDFRLADCDNEITVSFEGILPDLFREGQGIVATGYVKNGGFNAEEVLAKHDENYMPPELAEKLGNGGTGHNCAPFKSLEDS
ncbi:MAG: cytochrome c maturation protein CcmE [Oceanococcus sp.]